MQSYGFPYPTRDRRPQVRVAGRDLPSPQLLCSPARRLRRLSTSGAAPGRRATAPRRNASLRRACARRQGPSCILGKGSPTDEGPSSLRRARQPLPSGCGGPLAAAVGGRGGVLPVAGTRELGRPLFLGGVAWRGGESRKRRTDGQEKSEREAPPIGEARRRGTAALGCARPAAIWRSRSDGHGAAGPATTAAAESTVAVVTHCTRHWRWPHLRGRRRPRLLRRGRPRERRRPSTRGGVVRGRSRPCPLGRHGRAAALARIEAAEGLDLRRCVTRASGGGLRWPRPRNCCSCSRLAVVMPSGSGGHAVGGGGRKNDGDPSPCSGSWHGRVVGSGPERPWGQRRLPRPAGVSAPCRSCPSAAALPRRVSACSSSHSLGRGGSPCGERRARPPTPDRGPALPTAAAGSNRGDDRGNHRGVMIDGGHSVRPTLTGGCGLCPRRGPRPQESAPLLWRTPRVVLGGPTSPVPAPVARN